MSRQSLGPAIAAHAAAHGRELMAWQRLAVTHLFALRRRRLVHRFGLATVGRQNGKTTLAEAVLDYWLDERAASHGPQHTAIVTHDLRLTTSLFEVMATRLEERGVLAKVFWSHGRQELRHANGSRLHVQSDAPSAGHGLTLDFVLVDEVWDVSEACLDHGLIPAQRARPEPYLLMTSTAGTEASTLLRRWRDAGVASIDKGQPGPLAFVEWSPPPGADPLEESWWRWANPALGTTITLDTLRAEAEAPNRAAFLRAGLNWWISTVRAWLDPGVWDALACDVPMFAGGVLACEASVDGQRFVGVRAVPTTDGANVGVEILAADERSLWRAVDELMRADPNLALAVSPTLQVHVPPGLAKRCRPVGLRDLAQWTPLVRSYVNAERVHHRGEQSLAEHVNRAVTARTEGGEAISASRSPGPVELARCMVWSVALATRPTWARKAAVGGDRTAV